MRGWNIVIDLEIVYVLVRQGIVNATTRTVMFILATKLYSDIRLFIQTFRYYQENVMISIMLIIDSFVVLLTFVIADVSKDVYGLQQTPRVG